MADAAFKIERGVPIPEPRNAAGAITTTARALEIGDSFVTPADRHGAAGVWSKIRRLGPRKFAVRKIGDGAFRVWRVA